MQGAAYELPGFLANHAAEAGPIRELGPEYARIVELLARRERIQDIAHQLNIPERQLRSVIQDILQALTVAYWEVWDQPEEAPNGPWMAWRDTVTGLSNRSAGEYHLRWALDVAQRNNWPLSIVFIDVDNLKSVNDSQGHAAGDRVLEEVGQQLAQSVRRSDRVFRWGGDEFLMVLLQTGQDAAQHLIDRIRADAPELQFSAGPAQWEPGEPMANLIDRADLAMYRDKSVRKAALEGPLN